jgi:hypothetical protein
MFKPYRGFIAELGKMADDRHAIIKMLLNIWLRNLKVLGLLLMSFYPEKIDSQLQRIPTHCIRFDDGSKGISTYNIYNVRKIYPFTNDYKRIETINKRLLILVGFIVVKIY